MGTDLETWKQLQYTQRRLNPLQEVYALNNGWMPKLAIDSAYRTRSLRKVERLNHSQRVVLSNQQVRTLERHRLLGSGAL